MQVRGSDGKLTEPALIGYGVPQGSPFSPFLFNLFFATIAGTVPEEYRQLMRCYADDVKILLRNQADANFWSNHLTWWS